MGHGTYQRFGHAVRSRLPRGGELPAEEWDRRHRALTRILWATAAAIAVYSALSGYAVWHTALDASAVVVAGLMAGRRTIGPRLRSLACSFGLLTAVNEDVRRELRNTQDDLREAAMTDSLTGLPNRRRLTDDLQAAVQEGGARLGLFDLNGFKTYNDTFGHLAGVPPRR